MSVSPLSRRQLLVTGGAAAGLGLSILQGSTRHAELIASAAQPTTGGQLIYGQTFPVLNTTPYPRSGDTGIMRPNLFNYLTSFSEELQPTPELAESWELSADRLTMTMNLRQDVTFHSGRSFTAQDVVWNVAYAQDPANRAQIASQMKGVTATATSDFTVEFLFSVPLPQIFSLFLDMPIIDSESDIEQAVGGTGPFKFAELRPGDELRMVRNDGYWRQDRPFLDEIVVRIVPDQSALLVNLESGSVHVTGAIPLNEVSRLEEGEGTKTSIEPAPGNYNFLLNTSAPPFDDKRVRQAMGLALDRQRFTDLLMFGLTDPTYIVWPRSSPVWHADLDTGEFNLERARALLAEAGYPDGFETTIHATRGAIPEVFQFTQIYQADLAEIGVRATIEEVEANQWLTLITEAAFPGMLAHSYGTGNIDPGMLFTTHPFNPDGNAPRFQSEEYSRIIIAAQQEPDQDARIQLYRDLTELIKDEAFILPLANGLVTAGLQENVQDLRINRLGFPEFENVWLG